MKNNLKNRIFAIMLSVLMLIGMIPVLGADIISFKVKIDGNEVTLGKYVEGATVKLPGATVPAEKIFVGYKNSEGKMVTEVVATTEVLEYTTVLRNIPKGDYINERGNLANLKEKLEDGKLDIVFLGGSVTVGISGREKWASRVTDYLRAQYPGANITETNVGIGGTGSRLGSYRLEKDVLERNPDLVFVDFMLNDSYNSDYSGNTYKAGKNYEYILRTIREELPDTEIISLFITDKNSASTMGYGKMHPIGVEEDKIAENYNVTTIDVGRYMLESIFDEDKQFDQDTWDIYVSDYVHPGAYGHGVYAEVITSYLAGIKTATGEAGEYTVPDTYVYTAANGFVPDMLPLTLDGKTINPAIKNVKGFTLGSNGSSAAFPYKLLLSGSEASFEFEFTGTELAIYMNSPNKGSTVTVTVDGVSKSQDGQADTNGPREFFEKLEYTTHTAKIELSGVTSNGHVVGILVGADTIAPEPIDPTTIDCVITTANDIVADGTVANLIDNATANTKVISGNIELKGIVDGLARFGAKSSAVGTKATTNDRMLIDIDDIVFSEYPYCVISYKTNISATLLNFNMTTKNAVTSGDHKKFFAQSRIVGELAKGIGAMNIGFAEEGLITGVYVPIYSTTTPAMSADDYFDVQYVGFFKNADEAAAFDYEWYVENHPTDDDEEDTPVEEPGEIYVATPDDVFAEAVGFNADISVIEESGKSYLRFDPTKIDNVSAAINWSISTPLDATKYNFVKIGYKTNIKLSANKAIAIQVSKDNTFSWQAKYFEVADYSYWTEKTEVTVSSKLFNMTGKAAAAGATEIEFFRILPFSGQTAEALSGELYFDIEYVAFFEDEDDATAFDYSDYNSEEDKPADVLYGDANADGNVDRKDLSRLAQYFARWDVEIDKTASDANGDGNVDRKDLSRLAQFFARWDVELGK